MSFGMKNDLCFFLSIIFYKNRAERARKNTWNTNGYVQREMTSFLKLKQMSGHSGAGDWSGRVPLRLTRSPSQGSHHHRQPAGQAPGVFLNMSLVGELMPNSYSWEMLPVLLSFKNILSLWNIHLQSGQYYAIFSVLLLIKKILELCCELCKKLWYIPHFLPFCIAGPHDSYLSILSSVLHIYCHIRAAVLLLGSSRFCEALLKTRSDLIWTKKRSSFKIHITSV